MLQMRLTKDEVMAQGQIHLVKVVVDLGIEDCIIFYSGFPGFES